MTQLLSTQQVTILETLIKNKKLGHLYMSRGSTNEGKIVYKEILDAPINTYMIFACENFISYALYKSESGDIYVISVFMQTPNDYCSADLLK